MTTGFAQDDYIKSLEERIAELEYWLRWCLDNCDDSPEYNFGTDATEKMLTLLRGHKSE